MCVNATAEAIESPELSLSQERETGVTRACTTTGRLQRPISVSTDKLSVAPAKQKAPSKSTRQCDLKIASLQKQVDAKDKVIEELKSQVKKLIEDGEEREQRIGELLNSIRSKKGKKSRKEEQKQDVKSAIKEHVKFVLFRTTKFASPGEELTLATKKVWAGIKDKKRLERGPNKLTEKDFVEICDSVVSGALSDQRQCVQTRTSGCVKGE